MSFKKIIIKSIILLVLIFLVTSVGGVVLYSMYPLDYKEYIDKYAKENNIDPYLIASVINVESRFNKEAISPKGAKGLMQIIPSTGSWAAEELKIEAYEDDDLFNPDTNIKIGSWYLKKLDKEFGGNQDLVLAAYNGGSGNVKKWLKNEEYSSDGVNLEKIPFKETENYLKKVESNYEIYKKIYKDIDFKDESFHFVYIDFIYKIKDYIMK